MVFFSPSLISDSDIDTNHIAIKSNHGITMNINHDIDTLNDLDNEEAVLHEFDFLTSDNSTTDFMINDFKASK